MVKESSRKKLENALAKYYAKHPEKFVEDMKEIRRMRRMKKIS